MNRGVTADIDLDALSHNFRKIKGLVSNSPVFAVVKADAYGHGSVEIAQRLVSDGADRLAVAFTSEARHLRDSGITAPVMVLFDPDPDDVIKFDLIPVVHNIHSARELSRAAAAHGCTVNIHIKVDTGMGRLGIQPQDTETIFRIASMPNISIEGFMSHFSEADLSDLSFAQEQIAIFKGLRQELSAKGLKPEYFHLANSAAVINLPEAHMDAVRPGIMLYGCSPLQGADSGLRPVMRASVRVHSVRRVSSGTPISYGRTFIAKRDSVIAVLGIGYADGFRRSFSNNADVLIHGMRAPIAGRICMDLCMADITDIVKDADVAEGDEVVILGSQGKEFISADELASRAGTISYEVLTSIGARARKNYISASL